MIHFFSHFTAGQWFIVLVYPTAIILSMVSMTWIMITGPKKFDRQVKDLFTPKTVKILRKLEE